MLVKPHRLRVLLVYRKFTQAIMRQRILERPEVAYFNYFHNSYYTILTVTNKNLLDYKPPPRAVAVLFRGSDFAAYFYRFLVAWRSRTIDFPGQMYAAEITRSNNNIKIFFSRAGNSKTPVF